MTKKSSFLRQLNLYSFNRFSAGPDQGSYYHELFLKGLKFLSRRMQRQKVNGNRIRSAGNPEEEPNLSLFPACPPSATMVPTMHEPPANNPAAFLGKKISSCNAVNDQILEQLSEHDSGSSEENYAPP
jgi:hypothetical protein